MAANESPLTLVRSALAAAIRARLRPSGENVAFGLTATATILAVVALADLGVRALLRLDPSYDTFSYHLPFAALRTGIPVAFDMPSHFRSMFDGFPPLADVAQGLLWRLSGTVTAVQLLNWLALVGFLAYCRRFFRAPFWLVGLISLTAPLVAIHATVGYVDLFVNALFAIGATSLLFLHLFPERASRAVLVGGLIGIAAACWSKYTLVPIAAVLLGLYVPVSIRARSAMALSVRDLGLLVGLVVVFAAVPYTKNLVLYGNPLWPVRVPVVGSLFPYQTDAVAGGINLNRPPGLRDAPQAEVFGRSLFEIGVPTAYGSRPRYTLDQYANTPTTSAGMRMGGFWNVGVAFYLAALGFALVAYGRRSGAIAGVVTLTILGLVAVLPQSNELRYFMFIPLVWAGTIGMLFEPLRLRWRRAVAPFLVVVLAMFGYMAAVERTYYDPRPRDWIDVATTRGAAQFWPKFAVGQSYCAVGFTGTAFLMTGPTMREFMIYSRGSVADCPPGVTVVTAAGIQP